MKCFDVVGVGHSCVDKICTIENYPKEDGSTHITNICIQGGGAVATAMVAVSRLGLNSAFIGNIGYDLVSDLALSLFEKEGVDTSFLIRNKDSHGLESFVMVNPQTQSRTKFPQRDTNPPINFTNDLINVIRNSKILHLDGTNYQNAIEAAKIAKEHKVLVSLDGCSMQENNQKNKELASMADILIMNSKYPLRVTNKDNYNQALLEIASWGPKVVLCTLGVNGQKAVIDNQVIDFPAFRDFEVIDTTGAGDVFHGAFLVGFIKGLGLKKCIRFASLIAGIKCSKLGGREGIVGAEEAKSLFEKYCS